MQHNHHRISQKLTVHAYTNALNINSFHLPTKFLQPANLTTYTISSLFSLQVGPAPHLLSPVLTIYHSLDFSLQTQNSSLSQILSSIDTLIPSGLTSRILTCTVLKGHWRLLVLVSFFLATLRVLDKAEYSAFESTLNSSIVSCCIFARTR